MYNLLLHIYTLTLMYYLQPYSVEPNKMDSVLQPVTRYDHRYYRD
jgi:hypothetical protein